jgi:hypothetical protein
MAGAVTEDITPKAADSAVRDEGDHCYMRHLSGKKPGSMSCQSHENDAQLSLYLIAFVLYWRV